MTTYTGGVLREVNDHRGNDITTTYDSRNRSTTWEVTDDGGYLDDNGTLAFCHGQDVGRLALSRTQ